MPVDFALLSKPPLSLSSCSLSELALWAHSSDPERWLAHGQELASEWQEAGEPINALNALAVALWPEGGDEMTTVQLILSLPLFSFPLFAIAVRVLECGVDQTVELDARLGITGIGRSRRFWPSIHEASEWLIDHAPEGRTAALKFSKGYALLWTGKEGENKWLG